MACKFKQENVECTVVVWSSCSHSNIVSCNQTVSMCYAVWLSSSSHEVKISSKKLENLVKRVGNPKMSAKTHVWKVGNSKAYWEVKK